MFRRKRKLLDFTAEIEAHVPLETERLMQQGISEPDARAAARRAFGNFAQTRERFYESGRWLLWDHFRREVRYGLRMLAKTPGFTLVAILTLALGIGANTAIFSVVNALLLRSLPYPHPERIGTIYARSTGPEASGAGRWIDGEEWELLRDNVPALLSAVSSPNISGVNLQAGSHVQYLQAGRVSAHYFDVLALHPLFGRNFSENEDRPGGPKATILSYALWRSTLGANPDVVGQAILLKGEPYTVIGVLPPNATTPLNADLYTALQPTREGEGCCTNFAVTFRLSEGANWDEADAEIARAWSQSARVQGAKKDGEDITYYCVPLQKAQAAKLRPEVLILMLAAGFILLIACANLAGLTLVRMSRRTGEIATRIALGASRWQVQRQLWVENLLLAMLGGAAAVSVALVALRIMLLALPEHFLPVTDIPLDSRALAFTLGLSLFTSVLFGMLPALAARKLDIRSAIGSRSVVGGGSPRLRQTLIAAEVALTVVLLAGAGLLIRTLMYLETMPPGFNPSGVLTAKASLDDARYQDPVRFRKLLSDSLASMRRIPGVQDAAVGLTVPYERALITGVAVADGAESGRTISPDQIYVTPGYFETLQIPLLAGRTFTEADLPTAQPVVIINQTFARKYFRGIDPVGRYLVSGDNKKRLLIVGVVASTVGSSASRRGEGLAPFISEETTYIPAAQIEDAGFVFLAHHWFQPSWIVRTSGSVQGLSAEMQQAMNSAGSNLPFSGFFDMNDVMAGTLAMQRIEVALLTVMASLALLLSAVGIFALVANMVAQRTREIGIRMALGSSVKQAMMQFGRHGVGSSLLGVAVGLLLSAGALRVLRSALFGVRVYDIPTLAAVVFTLLAVALLASIVPTLKIAKIDPARTLRQE
jgi:predicted permease